MKPAPLTSKQAQHLAAKFGSNEIKPKKQRGPLSIFLSQFASPLVYILVVAAAITFFLGEYIDTAVIVVAVTINTALGFIQEYKANSALVALQDLISPSARVVRDNTVKIIPARELVPGDIVLLKSGDKIPADGTVIESTHFYINESILTGESVPVYKTSTRDKSNVFMGTVVTSGRGQIIVTETGARTKFGLIADTLLSTPEAKTPLQSQLTQLSRIIAGVVFILILVIFFYGIYRGTDAAQMFTTSVALAVSAIPEGMLISLTVILATGMQRILKRRALVRSLIAAETLGSTTVICADKTGTLTLGQMKVVDWDLTNLNMAAKAAIVANNMEDPIEMALWNWTKNNSPYDPESLTKSQERRAEIPFDGQKKYMAIQAGQEIYVKGAPEVLMAKSDLSSKNKIYWSHIIDKYGRKGLRMIAVAKKIQSRKMQESDINSLQFLGIFAVSDPVRPEVKSTLSICRKAGISVKVITGDFRLTSQSVLRQIGIEIRKPDREIMEGTEIEQIGMGDLIGRVRDVVLFCRVSPQHKLKIVQALQENGEVVAMTGDGVNDALALKKAQIGIVVESASDVARENADIVLLDSNLGTIVAAIAEGRGIYQNIKKIVLYLLSDSFLEMMLILFSLVFLFPLPMGATQILWINIIADGLPNLALAFDPKNPNLMAQKPRLQASSILSGAMLTMIALISLTTSLIAFIVFVVYYTLTSDLVLSQTVVFTLVGLASLFYVFSCRNMHKYIWESRLNDNRFLTFSFLTGFIFLLLPVYHPALNTALNTKPLYLHDWAVVIAGVMIAIMAVEFPKKILLSAHQS